jgi:hypothetical protein
MAEALPLVDLWRLERSQSEPFRLFEGEGRRLAVSGVGKERAAQATRWLAGPGIDPRTVWLDVGLCGHPSLSVGEIRAAHRVVDAVSGDAWYPPAVVPFPCGSMELRTVSRPERVYRDDVGYDMEAAGFLAAARKVATAELVQVVKVVSDNREAPPRGFRPSEVADLVRPHAPAVDRFVEGLRELATELPAKPEPDELFEALVARVHFTISRRRRLRDLLRRARALGLELDPATLGGDAERISDELRRRIEAVPYRIDP